jgi:hypothetical protein
MVNSSLKRSSAKYCTPGSASSVRMNMASSPATRNQKYEFTRYMIPIFLWSVVVSHTMIG